MFDFADVIANAALFFLTVCDCAIAILRVINFADKASR
jgi:hypothetical protein